MTVRLIIIEYFILIWKLKKNYLDNKRGASSHYFSWYLRERAVLDAHDLQIGAQRQFERQVVQIGVVVDVERLEILQGANLLWQEPQAVLANAEIRQVCEMATIITRLVIQIRFWEKFPQTQWHGEGPAVGSIEPPVFAGLEEIQSR